jgi:hypothetical protein
MDLAVDGVHRGFRGSGRHDDPKAYWGAATDIRRPEWRVVPELPALRADDRPPGPLVGDQVRPALSGA